MTIRNNIMLIENALVESADVELQSFLNSPQGELLKYTFQDAQTPVELQHAIIGTATEFRNAWRSGDHRVATDHGIVTGADMNAFSTFVSNVANDPETYFNAFHGTMQESNIDELEAEMPYLDGAEKEQAEEELISDIGEERYDNI